MRGRPLATAQMSSARFLLRSRLTRQWARGPKSPASRSSQNSVREQGSRDFGSPDPTDSSIAIEVEEHRKADTRYVGSEPTQQVPLDVHNWDDATWCAAPSR